MRSGDSGSPLFWDHPSGQRLLVGVAQGSNPGADLGRYTATFRGPTDISPHIGNWIWTHVPDAVYCEQALAAPAGTIPLVAYWSAGRTDNFLTSDPRWAGGHGTVRSPNYNFVRSEGFVFDPKRPRPPGTEPLFSWWHRDRGDNFISSDPRWSTDPARIRWQGEHVEGGPSQGGYTLYRLEGWVFDPKRPQPRGTVPIYSWWDGNRTDNFATSNPLESRARSGQDRLGWRAHPQSTDSGQLHALPAGRLRLSDPLPRRASAEHASPAPARLDRILPVQPRLTVADRRRSRLRPRARRSRRPRSRAP